ncbi:MAG: GNAT family N-acetyltransferase [Candidatus Brocadiia bacterium]
MTVRQRVHRPDLDLSVVAPDGELASGCIIWHNARNRMGILEPVCTHPDYRRRGLGRAVVLDAIRRAAALGATRAVVDTTKPFYPAIGFREKHTGHMWVRHT